MATTGTKCTGRRIGTATGIELAGLVKSFRRRSRRPGRPGIDVVDRGGRDGRAARPERRRQVDDDRHAARPAAEPDSGTVSVFGRSPSDGVDAGAVGAMLQTGALIRDLTVRELVAMMASLYPAPLDVDEVLELTGHRATSPTGARRSSRAARRSASASRSRSSRTPTCSSSTSRRWRWTSRAGTPSGRRCASSPRAARRSLFATHYLEEADAYADRVVLMAHGAIVADGPPTEIKAMVGTRTIRATLPDGRPRRELEAPAGRQPRRAARRGGRPRLRRLRRGDPRAARRATRRRATSRSPAPGSRRRSSSSPAATTTRTARVTQLAYTRYELLRTFRNRRFFFLSLGFPLVLYFLIAGPNRNEDDLGGTRPLGAALLHGRARGVRDDERDALGGRADRRRARGRLEPAAADHAAPGAGLLPREGADRLPDGGDRPRRRSTSAGIVARRQPRRPRLGAR